MKQQNKKTILKQAFESTTYRLQYGSEKYFDIPLHQSNPEFNRWLDNNLIQSWALITPYNPDARPHSESFNQRQWQKLKALLQQQQLTFYPAVHIAKKDSGSKADKSWPDEASFFITDISKSEALSIAREFDQQAFVFGIKHGEIVWCY